MPGFDRSKFKATPLATLKEQEADYETKRPSSGGGDTNYLKVEDGENWFRIFPAHPDGGGYSFSEAKCVSFLSVKTQKRGDDKKVIEGEFELKRRPFFNSKVHGGLRKDLVETYMDVAKKIAIPNFVGDDKEKFDLIWKKTTGMEGIKPIDSWVVYAKDKSGKIGLLELKKSIKTQLTEKATEFSTDVQSPDPYSDPEDGIPIIITKKGKGLDTEYKVSLESQTVKEKGRVSTEYVLSPITDAELEEFEKMDSLHKLYVGTFKRSDLEAQLEGLLNFDDYLKKLKYDIRVCEYDEFNSVVEELLELVPEEEEKEEEQKEPEPAVTKKVTKATPTVTQKVQSTTVARRQVQKAPEPEPVEDPIENNEEEEIQQPTKTLSTAERIAEMKRRAGLKK